VVAATGRATTLLVSAATITTCVAGRDQEHAWFTASCRTVRAVALHMHEAELQLTSTKQYCRMHRLQAPALSQGKVSICWICST
jgi:hypothetical protein